MVTEDAVRDEVMRLLRYANRAAIARELKVSDEAVSNWAKGKHTSPKRLEELQALLGAPVASQGQTKEAPPPWAEGLRAGLELLMLEAGIDPAVLDDPEALARIRTAIRAARGSFEWPLK